MIKIQTPENNQAEREYIFDYLFRQRLKINYSIEYKNLDETVFLFPNQKSIHIKDAFFNNFKTELSYLSLKNLPEKPQYVALNKFGEGKLPIIFGENGVRISENKIELNFDFLADIFFYLSRWDENITYARDELDRPIEKELFIVKHQLYKYPYVDIWVNLLFSFIQYLGYPKLQINTKYKITPTHDVDYVKKWKNTFHAWKEISGDTFKRKNIKRSFYNTFLWAASKLKFIEEPNDTISALIEKSEKYKRKAVFFFMAGGATHWDSFNIEDINAISNWINKIIKAKHSVGIHPSILSARSKEMLHNELQAFSNIVKINICCSRQHYLRLIIPQTWQVLEQNKIGWDSSCGFSNYLGFRCATANPFQVFDIKKRKMLLLKERPLIVMDTAIVEHIQMTVNHAIDEIKRLKKIIEKYSGNFIFLLHNSSLRAYEYKKYYPVWEELYK